MDRDFGAEIDGLKDELQQLRKWALQNMIPKIEPRTSGEAVDILAPEDRQQLNHLLAQLVAYCEDHHAAGAVAYTGTFYSGDGESTRQSLWTSVLSADDLLKLNDNRLVEKVLSSVGSSQKLAILLALLKKPMTAAQLVEVLGANTTGQVYHHLKPLAAANIIHEEKGVYAVIPYRVQGIVMLLAGVWDLIDTRYASGTWEEQS
jgi:DNA-binding transcriptional ArsR family regulator